MIDIENYISVSHKVLKKIDKNDIRKAIDLIINKINSNKKIITCGNGGSALTASHYITDWNKSYNLKTGKKLLGFSLNDNIGLITAIANDLAYEEIFSSQIKTIVDKEDLLIIISGSGKSKNIINAAKTAKEIGCSTLGIIGYDGGDLKDICDNLVHIPSWDMQICEDVHLVFGHLVMKSICSEDVKPIYE
tara:strand:- start:1056 stop:1628 length:573 start_codon:yes stop_codon:yes gene_type:complete